GDDGTRRKEAPADAILRGDDRQHARAVALREEVDGADEWTLLSDAVRTAVALIELHRVPGNVVVHDHAGALEVQTFGCEIGGDEQIDRAAAKRVDGANAVARRGQAAAQMAREIARRCRGAGEDERRLAAERLGEQETFGVGRTFARRAQPR